MERHHGLIKAESYFNFRDKKLFSEKPKTIMLPPIAHQRSYLITPLPVLEVNTLYYCYQ